MYHQVLRNVFHIKLKGEVIMKNKVLALFLCFVLVLGTNSIIFAQDTIQLESLPDDYFSNIYEYKYYENVRGTLTEDHDHQVFSWTVPEQQEYIIETTGNFATRLTEYTVNSDGEIIYSGTYTNENNDNINAKTKITAMIGTKYYFVIDAANTRDLFRNETPTFFRIRSEYNELIDDYTNYTDTANDNAETGNYSNYVKKNCKIDYDGDVDVFVYNGCIGNGTIEFEKADLPLNVTVYTLPNANDFGEQQRVKTFNIDFSGPLPQPITFSKNERVFIVIKQDQTGNYDEINSQYTFRYYAPNKMDQYDLDANSEYGNVPMYASDLGIGFHIAYPTLHYNDYDYYTFTPEYDGTEITATLGSTSSDLLYDINLYENIIINPSQPTLYPTNPIASGVKEDNKKILRYNELKSGTKYYLEVKSPSPKTIYDSQNPYELTVIKKNTYSAVLKNDIILQHTAGNDINTTKDFFDIIMQNIECKVSDSIIPSDEARGHIQLIYNDRALSYSDINKLEPGEYPIIVKFYGDAATGGTVTLKVSKETQPKLFYTGDGFIYPRINQWWETWIEWRIYDPNRPEDLFSYCHFGLEDNYVICKDKLYSVPSASFIYDTIFNNCDYSISTNYLITVKVTYDGTAEYLLSDPSILPSDNKPIYYDTYAIIPIALAHSDINGQLFVDSELTESFAYSFSYQPVKNNLSNIKEISSDRDSAVALDSNGNVYAWGDGSYYDLGTGNKDNVFNPVKVEGLPKIVQIAKGKHHTLALDENGNIWGWGNNSRGEVHGSLKGKVTVPTQIPGIDNVISIAAGTGFSAAIKNDGTVWTWGDNQYDKLGDRESDISSEPSKVIGINNVSKVTCGEKFTAALSEGNLYTWGDNSSGQLGDGTNTSRSTPQLIGSGYTDIAAGNSHMLAILDNDLYTWGYNSVGQLGLNNKTSKNTPQLVFSNVSKIGAGYNHSMMVSDGKLYTWGGGGSGRLGNGGTNNTLKPTIVPSLKNINIVGLDGGYDFSLVLDNNGRVWSCGSNKKGQLGLYPEGITK